MIAVFSFNHQGREPSDAIRAACENELRQHGMRLLIGRGAYLNRSGHYNTEVSYCAKVTRPSQLQRILELCRASNQESILLLNNLASDQDAVTVATLHYLDGRTVDIGHWTEVPRNHAITDENGFSEFNGKYYVVRQGA